MEGALIHYKSWNNESCKRLLKKLTFNFFNQSISHSTGDEGRLKNNNKKRGRENLEEV